MAVELGVGVLRLFLHTWEGEVLGELNGARNRRLTTGLNRSPSLSFDIPLQDNPLGEELFEAADALLSRPQETDFRIVSAYRLNPYSQELELLFSGPILLARDGGTEGDEATASFTCAGPFWRMGTRIADNSSGDGRSEAGLTISGQRGRIAAQLIRDTNSLVGNSWLRAPEEGIEETDEVEIRNWGGFRSISQAINDLSGEGSLGGFDWAVVPRIDTDSEGLALGDWICAPLIGADLTDSVVFEYGIGRNNLSSSFRSRSLENLANLVSHVSSGNQPYVVEESSPASIAKLGVFEAIADGDLIDVGLRQSWVELNNQLRSLPRRLFEASPQRSDLASTVGSIPIPMIDYGPGDRVRVRSYYGDRLRFDVGVRIYSIDISWSETGEEKAELGLYLE
jgi:hypothetical protein